MITKSTKTINKNVTNFVSKSYQYGFSLNVEKNVIQKGLNKNTLKLISSRKIEPLFLLNFRIKAYEKWKLMNEPEWAFIKYPAIDYQNISYFSAPKLKKNNIYEIDNQLLKTFNKLGISLSEQKRLTNVAVDAIFDSISIKTTFQKELSYYGVIFSSIADAIHDYPKTIQKYLGSVIPIGDNYFSSLNSAVFTDGSFCYIPKYLICPIDLSTYFRINDQQSGQFERTLIIANKKSQVKYLEGCTAPQYDTNQLHAAIVELIALKKAKIDYSTVQNWYSGNEIGDGGIFNFVTKRGICLGTNSTIYWTQVETGSAITWKYPSCILMGNQSLGEFYSVTLTNKYQQADTGTKMIHFGKSSKSRIISKGISAGQSKNSYRGLVNVKISGLNSKNYSQCDSLLIGNQSNANTFPILLSKNSTSQLEHEAVASKIGEEQIFYFLQRGISFEKAIELMVNGFCKEVFQKLPLEFANEANKLLTLKMDGSVG